MPQIKNGGIFFKPARQTTNSPNFKKKKKYETDFMILYKSKKNKTRTKQKNKNKKTKIYAFSERFVSSFFAKSFSTNSVFGGCVFKLTTTAAMTASGVAITIGST